jgi:5-methylcytosine-specific restriction endonuclease McrA
MGLNLQRGHTRYSKRVTATRRWQALRLEALRRDGFRCVICGATGRLEVDHIKPVRTHPELSFKLGNLQTLCASDHARKTRSEVGNLPDRPERQKWRNLLREMQRNSKEMRNA